MKDKNEKQVTLRGGQYWEGEDSSGRGRVKEGSKEGEYG
jgi:hypothetical protein